MLKFKTALDNIETVELEELINIHGEEAAQKAADSLNGIVDHRNLIDFKNRIELEGEIKMKNLTNFIATVEIYKSGQMVESPGFDQEVGRYNSFEDALEAIEEEATMYFYSKQMKADEVEFLIWAYSDEEMQAIEDGEEVEKDPVDGYSFSI